MIRQPLLLGEDLKILVPLCEAHNRTWELFANKQGKAVRLAQKVAVQTSQEVDAALAWAIIVHPDP